MGHWVRCPVFGGVANDEAERPLWPLRREHLCWRNVNARTCKYLNNVVEQDHRAIKRRRDWSRKAEWTMALAYGRHRNETTSRSKYPVLHQNPSAVQTECPDLAFERLTFDEGLDVRAGASMLGCCWTAYCRPTHPLNWEAL